MAREAMAGRRDARGAGENGAMTALKLETGKLRTGLAGALALHAYDLPDVVAGAGTTARADVIDHWASAAADPAACARCCAPRSPG